MDSDVLELVYQDEHLAVINKPPRLLVHRSPIDRHETRFALQMLRDQIQQRVYPVHRLDKPTSGLLVFALSAKVARVLSEQFAQRAIDKRYLAVVRGYCPELGDIRHALNEKHDAYTKCRADPKKPAQEAHTGYRRLATIDWPEAVDRYPTSRYSLVELRPHTGRRHQLRRHMKHIGHPIIGDTNYGKGVHNRFFATRFGCSRLLLACTRLTFSHPISGFPVHLVAAPDSEYRSVLKVFDWTRAASQAFIDT